MPIGYTCSLPSRLLTNVTSQSEHYGISPIIRRQGLEPSKVRLKVSFSISASDLLLSNSWQIEEGAFIF